MVIFERQIEILDKLDKNGVIIVNTLELNQIRYNEGCKLLNCVRLLRMKDSTIKIVKFYLRNCYSIHEGKKQLIVVVFREKTRIKAWYSLISKYPEISEHMKLYSSVRKMILAGEIKNKKKDEKFDILGTGIKWVVRREKDISKVRKYIIQYIKNKNIYI